MNKLKGKVCIIVGSVLLLAALVILELVNMAMISDAVICVVMAMPILAYCRSNYNWIGVYMAWLAFVLVIRVPVCEWYAIHGEVVQLPISLDFYLYKMVVGLVNLSGMLLWVAAVSLLSLANVGKFIKGKDKSWKPNCKTIRVYNNFVSTTAFAYVVICVCSLLLYGMKAYVINVAILAGTGLFFYIAYVLSRRLCVREIYKRNNAEKE